MLSPLPLLLEAEQIAKSRGWSRYELYRRLGIPRSSFSRWIRGQRTPSLANWYRLNRALDRIRK